MSEYNELIDVLNVKQTSLEAQMAKRLAHIRHKEAQKKALYHAESVSGEGGDLWLVGEWISQKSRLRERYQAEIKRLRQELLPFQLALKEIVAKREALEWLQKQDGMTRKKVLQAKQDVQSNMDYLTKMRKHEQLTLPGQTLPS